MKKSYVMLLAALLLCLLAGNALAAGPTTLHVGGVNALVSANDEADDT